MRKPCRRSSGSSRPRGSRAECWKTSSLRMRAQVCHTGCMITLKSSKASRPVEVRCEDNLREQGQWLADTIAEFETRGRSLGDGAAMDVGWTTFILRGQPDGSLRVCEPDYGADPFKTLRPEVTTSLTVLAAQIDLVRSFGLEAVPCR